jgi:hypothetical protein
MTSLWPITHEEHPNKTSQQQQRTIDVTPMYELDVDVINEWKYTNTDQMSSVDLHK